MHPSRARHAAFNPGRAQPLSFNGQWCRRAGAARDEAAPSGGKRSRRLNRHLFSQTGDTNTYERARVASRRSAARPGLCSMETRENLGIDRGGQ